MPYAAVAYFDADSEATIKELWRALHEENLGTSLYESGLRPHVTLGVWEEPDLEVLTSRLERLAAEHSRFQLNFDVVGAFAAGDGSIVLVPSVTRQLVALHETLHHDLDEYQSEDWIHYQPDRWVPHCTVAMDIPRADLPRALDIALTNYDRITPTLEELFLAEFYPVEVVASYPLSRS